MRKAWRVAVAVLLFWLMILVYMSTTLYQSTDVSERTVRQLQKALSELEDLKGQNAQLQTLANELKDIRLIADQGNNREVLKLRTRLKSANDALQKLTEKPGSKKEIKRGEGPGLYHEQARRRVQNGVVELWYYLSSEVRKIRNVAKGKGYTDIVAVANEILQDGATQQRSVMMDLYNLSLSDGAAEWRQKLSSELSDLVQRRIHYLQNPADCSKAKKLVCNLNKGCGYGCQLHHLVYCFIIAYGTERTLIVQSRGWRYSSGGWEKVFKPVSDTCVDKSGASARGWGPHDMIKDYQVITLPIVDSLHPRPPYMPMAIPEDIAPKLMALHGHPIVWWIGQFLKYVLKPQPSLAKDMEETKKLLRFQHPIVGVHVRRTDKVGTEAAFHGITEYMVHVDAYYEYLERRENVERRRVYLATDDASVLKEARRKFKKYEFISDNEISKSAGLGTRYTDKALRGIIMDIHFLSITDYLVCTFSSQVCRVAYEIMQTYHPDASAWFHSLDDIYYYGGQNAHNQEAMYKHSPRHPNEIELSPGDTLGVAGNHWDGYSKGVNKRSGRTGLYPSYKVQDQVDIVKFPTYPEADRGR